MSRILRPLHGPPHRLSAQDRRRYEMLRAYWRQIGECPGYGYAEGRRQREKP